MPERARSSSPVVKHVRVSLGAEEAFELFTRKMGTWWPLDQLSVAADTHGGRIRAVAVTFEEGPGGRIVETMSEGSQATWGYVQAWEPPHRVVFSWKPNLEEAPYTEVEVRFVPEASGTLVELEHRGWERLDDGEARRAGYDRGWPGVLARFAQDSSQEARAGA